jgi:Na+/melibiose symporter-like transporter
LLSWRVGFFVNVPIGIAMLLAAPRYLAETKQRPGRFDRAGAASSTLGMTSLVYGIVQVARNYSPLEAGLAFLPMTVTNFAMAIAVPRLTKHFGNALLLAGGVTVTLIGMAWLSRLSADISYVTGIALPMILIGIGQGASLGPLTSSGIAGVASKDDGAASGLVNVAHQLGGSLGLGILVTIFAAAGSAALSGREQLAHRVATSLAAGTAMLGLALVVVFVLIVRSSKNTQVKS